MEPICSDWPLIILSVLVYYIRARTLWSASTTDGNHVLTCTLKKGDSDMTLQLRWLMAAAIAFTIFQAPMALAQEAKVTSLMAQPLPGFAGPEKEGRVALVEF